MEELKNLIKTFFNNNKKYHTIDELRKNLKIKGEEQTNIFNAALTALVEDGSLFFDERKGYRIFSNDLGIAFGELQINKSGTGFVHTNDGYTIIIENIDLNGALDGDKVIVSSIDNKRKDYYSGEISKVIKRKNGKVVFEVVGNGINASLIPHNKFTNINVIIHKNQLKNLIDGQLVVVDVGTECFEKEYFGQIDKVIGHKNDPDIDLELLATEYNIPTKFSDQSLKEAKKLPKEVGEEDLKDRIDLRNENTVTIDCDNTKDRDDSIIVTKLSNGNFKLKTNISDISHYIKRGMSLFDEAHNRGTSHYPNNTCIPMFPVEVSNGICSLNENVDRLTKTVEIEIDSKGNIIDINIYKSVINSKKAMKYSEVNRIFDGEIVNGYEQFINDLKLMKELSDICDLARRKRDCMDFDIPDPEIIQDENKKTTGFRDAKTGIAERIIENLMVVTNTAVAMYYSWLPFVYRIHEIPDEKVVKDVLETLKISGFDIPKIKNINEKTLVKILEKIKDADIDNIIKTNLLKSMKRARYDVQNAGHFALQIKKYCHFTSPIRRIADFEIHTLIDDIDTLDYSEEGIKTLENELNKVCEIASQKEKLADDFETEAMNMAMAEFMEDHIGEEFSARVIEISKNGLLIKTSNNVTGKLKLSDMLDDKYYYDDDKKAIIGKYNKKKYQLGNKICVISKEACKQTRTINFTTGKQKSYKY